MRTSNDPDFAFDCERCGKRYEVRLDCVNRAFSARAVLRAPKLCPDCNLARIDATLAGLRERASAR